MYRIWTIHTKLHIPIYGRKARMERNGDISRLLPRRAESGTKEGGKNIGEGAIHTYIHTYIIPNHISRRQYPRSTNISRYGLPGSERRNEAFILFFITFCKYAHMHSTYVRTSAMPRSNILQINTTTFYTAIDRSWSRESVAVCHNISCI